MRLTEITDDLTGAADSGSYFTARGRKVRICTNGRCSLEHETDEILTVNLSSRNTAQDKARQLHADLLRRLEPGGFYMKKIGTGFRGNDSYELDGLLDGWPDYNVFIVDNAPDLGTFTLYGNQYCEGEILPKSVYANDPIFPPTESYIPKILGKDTDKKIGLVDIDAVKGGEETLLAAVEHQLAEETRILVFDAITRADVLHLLKTLAPRYPKVFWTGSLGIADGLAEYLYGPAQPHTFPVRDIRSLCFCASAYDIAHKQITYSAERGLQTVPLDIDAYIEGGKEVPQRAAKQAEHLLGQKPSKETRFHLDVYRLRPEINYIIHAHPTYSVLWTLQKKPLPLYTESAKLKLGEVPIVPDRAPGSTELADAVAETVANASADTRAFLMEGHGILVMGKTMEECFDQAELLEDTAKIAFLQQLTCLR